MKSARSLATGWIHQLPLERRAVLVTALVLVVMLSSLVLYARWRDGTAPRADNPGAAALNAAMAAQPEPPGHADLAAPGTLASPTTATSPAASDAQTAGAGAAELTNPTILTAGTESAGVSATAGQGDAVPETAAAEGALAEPVELALPLAGEPEVLQAYEFAFSPLYEDYRLHPGIDFAAAEGQAVLAAAPGKVVSVETDLEAGMAVVLDHGGGLMTRYAGLGRVLVRPEMRVAQGARLGTVRKPADGAEPFLHFEVLEDGDPVDPSTYLFQ